MTVLRLETVSHHYGALHVLAPVTLVLPQGARHAITGPNGSGKTTLLNIIGGSLKPSHGNIFLHGQRINGLPVHRRAALGLGRVFQHPHLSGRHTAAGNVLLALARRHHLAQRITRPPARVRQLLDEYAADYVERAGLAAVMHRPAGQLSHGQRRQLELAVTLAAGANVLLLDEPTAGLSTPDTEAMVDTLRGLPPTITLLMTEHDHDVLGAVTTSGTTLAPPGPPQPGGAR